MDWIDKKRWQKKFWIPTNEDLWKIYFFYVFVNYTIVNGFHGLLWLEADLASYVLLLQQNIKLKTFAIFFNVMCSFVLIVIYITSICREVAHLYFECYICLDSKLYINAKNHAILQKLLENRDVYCTSN